MKTSEAKLKANAEWRARHREAHLERRRLRYAELKVDPNYVARCKELRDARKEKKAEYDKAYRSLNRDRVRENERRKVKANPSLYLAIRNNYKHRRRAIEAAGIESATLAAWTAEQPKVCFYCGSDCGASFHVDHFMPLAKGGAHVLTNLRIACQSCNLRKNAKLPDEWIEEITEAT